ncbi:uncharacterized protein LOC114167268 [Vigna unguiculata]|uniref:uncharacterized protein LOC114167268 n=1 Tax=Vigna unguiculata TaxID=3917 RepID=UPI001016ABCA|nr:uncharacterized protein LOC114167268 [Vigna unguiculata]XP_027908106.1 uncharacterized protein LOC114167268 [Vigna unguiculata]
MSSNEEVTIPLTYWVDDSKNRVVVAEASGDFVDILFSFLTLPLGTIIRLGNKLEQHIELGCINKLYESVDKLESNVFWNNVCKKMLHSPRNPLESSCQRLKVKVDDTEPTRYFVCHSCSKEKELLLSTFDGGRCQCGKLMRKETKLLEESKEELGRDNGVFVKSDAMFLILDDLRVLRSSVGDSVQTFLKHRHKDISKLTEKSENVGLKEILSILKQALISKCPLSDVLLKNEGSKKYSSSQNTGPIHSKGHVKIKVMVRKSENKILFAEVDAGFVDLLASFLTTPIGSIVKLMKGNLCLGSIRNLYKSVKHLNPSWFVRSSNESLLNIKVAPHFGCKSNPLGEEDSPQYWYGPVVEKDNEGRTMISKKKEMLRDPKKVKLFDPRSSDGAREAGVGFMKRPCLFLVTDDLEMKPMTASSSISYLKELGIENLNDLEEHFIKVRKSHEALDLLRVSLTNNKDALTKSLFSQFWICQRCIPCLGVLGSRQQGKTEIKKEKKEIKKEEKVISVKKRNDEGERDKKEVK